MIEADSFEMMRQYVLHERVVSFQIPIGLRAEPDPRLVVRELPVRDLPAGLLLLGQMRGRTLPVASAKFALHWDFFGVVGEKGARVLLDGDRMPGARFFPDARLNFAENLLTGGAGRDGASDALVFRGEQGASRYWSWDDLRGEVSRLQQALAALGVGPGDRVAGLLPNIPEAVAAMLAAVSLGAVWSSASPDFGVRGVLDRFGQIAPKLLFTADGYRYAGKRIELAGKLAELQPFLPSVGTCVVVGHLGDAGAAAAALSNGVAWADLIAPHPATALRFARLPFDHPLVIL